MIKYIYGEPYVFVSYSSKDKEKVVNALRILNEEYNVNIWYDANLIAGNTWTNEVKRKLVVSQAVLFFGSVNALTSPNVLKEVSFIKNNYPKHPFIPISFEKKHFSKIIQEVILAETSGYRDDEQDAALDILDYLNNNTTRVNLDDEDYIKELYKAISTLAPKAILGDKKNVVSDKVTSNNETKMAYTVPNSSDDKDVSSKVTSSQKIKYTLYGKSHSDNQSDFMFTVFKEVLSKKPSAIKEVINQLTCATDVDFTLPENRNSRKMKPYFRTSRYFNFSNGEGVCIGTSYNYNEKLVLIAKLLKICGENQDVLQIKEASLPTVEVAHVIEMAHVNVEKVNSDSGINYIFDGKVYKGTQSEMMSNIFEKIILKHPHKLEELSSKLTCISLVDYDLPENRVGMKPYFRARKMLNIAGEKCCVGTSYSLKDKKVLIRKLLNICGEPKNGLTIDGQVL